MEQARPKRRLVAILAADIAGYSRLVGRDEEGTLARFKTIHNDIIVPRVALDNGRIVKTMGDGYLIEFSSVIDAARNAVAIQNAMAEQGRGASDEYPLEFRMGINLGDIIVEGDDILGDGVNIAARLESIAEPGSIFLSRAAFDQIDGRPGLETEFLGERELKNISKPVGVYRIVPRRDSETAAKGTKSPPPFKVPEKPSIAVLPLDNMSGDREQDYFTDGMTEDIITELSRFSQLFVIARNSSFTYKGRAVKVQDVRNELGVRYVVEGSVRKSGDRVRVTVQLIDAETGNHVWAERYDRKIEDIFVVQDELTQSIVAAMAGRVDAAEKERLKRKPPNPMDALDYLVAGRIHHHRVTPIDNAKAVELLNEAIALDPQFAEAYAWKACTLGQAMEFGFGPDRKQLENEAMAAVTKALALDENNVECHRLFCEIYMETHDLERAVMHGNRAINLNPNDPRLVAQQGELRTWLGKADEAVEWLEKSIRLDPHGAVGRAHLLGRALYGQGKYADALRAFQQVTSSRYDVHAFMAACRAQLGAIDEAKAQAERVLKLRPDFAVGNYVAALPYSGEADRSHLAEALRKAGLPQ